MPVTVTGRRGALHYQFPVVCIRTSTERPEAVDEGRFFISGIDEKGLLHAVECAYDMNANGGNGLPVPNYTDENVTTKVVKIIQSYVGIRRCGGKRQAGKCNK